jgi:hypothetical protein
MRYSLCLLTLTLLAGAPLMAAPPISDQTATPAAEPTPAPSGRIGLRERLHNLFLPSHTENPAPSLTTKEKQGLPTRLPTATAQQPAAASHLVPELSAKDLERVGHEQDYSWITGKLFHVSAQGGRWLIHYAGQYEVDQYGGTLLLAPSADLAKLRAGDLVCVHGQVVAGQSAKPYAGAVYQVKEVNLIEHAAP